MHARVRHRTTHDYASTEFTVWSAIIVTTVIYTAKYYSAGTSTSGDNYPHTALILARTRLLIGASNQVSLVAISHVSLRCTRMALRDLPWHQAVHQHGVNGTMCLVFTWGFDKGFSWGFKRGFRRGLAGASNQVSLVAITHVVVQDGHKCLALLQRIHLHLIVANGLRWRRH